MALGWPGFARRREPAVHNKKTLVSAQNLENKGPEIFLPPRSMVLKVVRGKILETLELCASQGMRFRFGFGRTTPWNGQKAAFAVRLSKIVYYLTDNLYICMLSEVGG